MKKCSCGRGTIIKGDYQCAKCCEDDAKVIRNEMAEERRRDRGIRRKLREVLTEYKYRKVCAFLKEDGYTSLVGIVEKDKVRGREQKEDYWFKVIHIDQRSGVCEDDYYGNIWVPLPNGKYLQFSFWN